MSYTRDQQQALALAAIFQASLLADQLASRGQCASRPLSALTDSVMALDATDPETVFPDTSALEPGLTLLEQVFRRGQQRDNLRPMGYALALVQLANRLRKDSALTSILRNRLEALRAQRAHFDDTADADFCHRLAGIYLDTLGTLRFRIRVHGEPEHLRNEDTAARIRALFLAGIRAAFLWRQCGGRRWHLLTRRARILRAIEEIKSTKSTT